MDRFRIQDIWATKQPVKDYMRLLPSKVLEKCLEVSAFGVKAVSLSQDIFRADLDDLVGYPYPLGQTNTPGTPKM